MQAAAPAGLRGWPWANIAVAVAVVGGIGLRVWIAFGPLGTLDADEGAWSMMALRTLHGHPTTFFWHQAYGGTHEVFVLAAAFAVTGPSIAAVRLVQIAFYAAAALLVWRIGRRTIGEPAARLAASLFWVWPAFLVWRSTREYGFYGSALVLSLLVVLLVLRVRERVNTRDAVLLGLVCGLGLWATPQVFFVAVPALAWLVWRAPAALRKLPQALVAALVGASPWLIWNLRNDWGSFNSLPAGEHNSYVDRLVQFAATTLPTILGLRVPWSLDWIADGRWPGRALTAALMLGVVWLLVRRRGKPVEPIAVIALGFPFLYALSPYDWLIEDPRYMTMLAPIAALLLAYAATRVRWGGPVLIAVGLALTVTALVPMERDRLTIPIERGFHVPDDIGPALAALDEAGVHRVKAPYWSAYRLEFESGGHILVDPITGNGRDLYARRLVRRTPHPAWVFPANQPLDLEQRPALEREGYIRSQRGDWSIYLWPGATR